MGGYGLEFFVQGKGWVDSRALLPQRIIFKEYDDALNFAASLIEGRRMVSEEPYGSRAGDVVGFRVVRSDDECSDQVPAAHSVTFSEVRHRFFRRGHAYILYKSWSWPD